MKGNVMKKFMFALALFALPTASALAQTLTCRFESVDDLAGREHSSGTVLRTATAAIVEYDSGTWTQTYTCAHSAYDCQGDRNGLITNVDFSYPGLMVLVTFVPEIGMTIIGLAHLDCR